MPHTYFSAEFCRVVARVRYAVYATFALIAALYGGTRGTPPYLLCLLLIFASGLFHGLHLSLVRHCSVHRNRRPAESTWPSLLFISASVLEWILLLLAALLQPLSNSSAVLLMFSVAACQTSLFGWRWLACVVVPGVVALVVWQGLHPRQLLASPLWLDAVALAAFIGFMFLVCLVAYQQSHLLLKAGAALKDRQGVLLKFLPKALSDHLGKATRSGAAVEIWATVVFIDLEGFTQATRHLDPGALTRMLNTFFDYTNTQVECWGGWVGKFLGDGVLCVFPAASIAERSNAAVQAIRCARLLGPGLQQLRASLTQANDYPARWDLNVSIGVASGGCLLGEWGGQARLDFTVIGPPVNLAARLQTQAAARGGVLADETTARLVEVAEPLGKTSAVNLKGVGEVCAYTCHLPGEG